MSGSIKALPGGPDLDRIIRPQLSVRHSLMRRPLIYRREARARAPLAGLPKKLNPEI